MDAPLMKLVEHRQPEPLQRGVGLEHPGQYSLGDHHEDFDIDGIVDDLAAAHDGELTSIDDFDSESYWAIVETHDTTV